MEAYLLIFTNFRFFFFFFYSSLYPSSHFIPYSGGPSIICIQSISSYVTIPGGSLYHNSLTNLFLLLITSTPPRFSSAPRMILLLILQHPSPASSSIWFCLSAESVDIPIPRTAIANQISRICKAPLTYGKRNLISVVFVCYWPDPRWGITRCFVYQLAKGAGQGCFCLQDT